MRTLAAVFLATAVLSAQTPEPPLLPYVASIKVNASGSDESFTRRLPGGTFLASNIRLHNLIALAHGLQPFQVEGGPDWTREVRFDITIKTEMNVGPAAIGATQIGLQLARAVLAERFAFKAHSSRRFRSSSGSSSTPRVARLKCSSSIASNGPCQIEVRLKPDTTTISG